MEWMLVLLLGTVHSVLSTTKPPITQECFTAAVYEHVHEDTEHDTLESALQKNIEAYEKAGKKAKDQGADILILPELGLYSVSNKTREVFRIYAEDIPDSKGSPNPCDSPKNYRKGSFLVAMSCLAKKGNMYVVLNAPDIKKCDKSKDSACPEDDVYIYNTNVAFDRKGTIVGRYHKRHPYFEPFHNTPQKTEYVYFDTDFGRIGMVVCFDIIFKETVKLVEDYEIDTLAYPTWWYDGQPFLISNQIQQAFAFVNKINFLGADIQRPAVGTLGSGIYTGVNGAVNFVHKNDGKPRLLVSKIPSQSGPGKVCKEAAPSKIITLKSKQTDSVKAPILPVTGFTTNLTHYALSRVIEPKGRMEVCHNEFCCNLEYELNDDAFKEGEIYYFGAYNGSDDVFQHYFWGVQTCVLAKMSPKSSKSQYATTTTSVFNRVDITAKFTTKYVYPSVLGHDLQILKKSLWDYKIDEESGMASISLSGYTQPILTVALYGRVYERDPEYRQ